MTLIDRQIEVIAGACAVTTATVRAVIAGERVGDGPDERVRAALSLIGFVPPLPRPSPNLDLFVNPVDQAVLAMRYNGNGPECLPHLACGGIGCDDCIGGARRCGMCVHRVAVTTVADGTSEGMDVCGWCADEAKKAGAGAELDRKWLAAGAEIRAERAKSSRAPSCWCGMNAHSAHSHSVEQLKARAKAERARGAA